MIWSPKTLKCQIYDGGNLIDLNKCSDEILEDLADCAMTHWKTPHNSAVWFDTGIYEKHYWFKPTKTTIEIECFKFDLDTHDKRKQLDISKLHINKMLGKKFKITPKETLIRKWTDNVEVVFVA